MSRAKQLGVSDADYARMLEAQHGGCAICGNPPKTRRLSVDHDHRTGRVRGLLCFRCNRGLPTYATDAWLLAAALYVTDPVHSHYAEPWGYIREHLAHLSTFPQGAVDDTA